MCKELFYFYKHKKLTNVDNKAKIQRYKQIHNVYNIFHIKIVDYFVVTLIYLKMNGYFLIISLLFS